MNDDDKQKPIIETEKQPTTDLPVVNLHAALTTGGIDPMAAQAMEKNATLIADNQAKIDALLTEPIDMSKGYTPAPSSTATPTHKIAAQRTLGTQGAEDYRQFEYGVDSPYGTYANGLPTNGEYVTAMGAGPGLGGGIVGGDISLRPMDGSRGNPYFFDQATPQIFNEVIPYEIEIPELNIAAEVTTTDPRKIAYQLRVGWAGEPKERYLGYDNIDLQPKETWLGAISKFTSGLVPAVINTGVNLIEGTLAYPSMAALKAHAVLSDKGVKDAISAMFEGGKLDEESYNKLITSINDAANNSKEFIRMVDSHDQFKDYWNKFYTERFVKDYNLMAAGDANMLQQSMISALPDLASQMFFAYSLFNIDNPILSKIATGTMFGILNTDEGYETIRERMPGLMPSERLNKALKYGIVAGALDYVPFEFTYGWTSKLIDLYTSKAVTAYANGALHAFLATGGEVITEDAQSQLLDYMTDYIQPNTAQQRWDERTLQAMSVGIFTVPFALGTQVRKTSFERARAAIRAGDAKKAFNDKYAPKLVLAAMLAARNPAMPPAEIALDIMEGAGTPAGQAFFMREIKNRLDGLIDQYDPETVKKAYDIVRNMDSPVNVAMQNFRGKVQAAIPAEVTGNTRSVVSSMLEALNALSIVEGAGEIQLPKIEVVDRLKDKAWGKYDPETNTLQISRNPGQGPLADALVTQGGLPGISQQDATWLHEFKHFFGQITGQSPALFEKFLPRYFDILANVYGLQQAGLIRRAMTDKELTGEKDTVALQNTEEWMAMAWARAGEDLLESLGFTGDPADVIDVATLLAANAELPSLQAALGELTRALQKVAQENDQFMMDMAKIYGDGGLQRRVSAFINGDVNALTPEDVKGLLRAMETVIGFKGREILKEAFSTSIGSKDESFSKRIRREFKDAIRRNVAEDESSNINSEEYLASDREDIEKQLSNPKRKLPKKDFSGKDNPAKTDPDSVDPFGDDNGEKFLRPFGWNASPQAQYDVPSTDYVGTGENALAHGWGVYYLEHKPYDKMRYWLDLGLRKGIMPVSVVVGDAAYKLGPAEQDALRGVFYYDPEAEATLQENNGEYKVKEGGLYKSVNEDHEYAIEDFLLAIDRAEIAPEAGASAPISVRIDMEAATGQIQKVLLPDTTEMLDEREPLSKQSKFVIDAIHKMATSDEFATIRARVEEAIAKDSTGRGLYRSLQDRLGNKKDASLKLAEYGIKGIAYKGESDGFGAVVFAPEKDVDVVETIRGNENIVRYSKPFNAIADAQETGTELNEQREKTSIAHRGQQKINGRNLDEDAELLVKNIKGIKKTPAWANKIIGGRSTGTAGSFLWLFGDKELADKQFPLERLYNSMMSDAMLQNTNLQKTIIGDGKVFKSKYEFDKAANEARIPSIKARVLSGLSRTPVERTFTPAQVMNHYIWNKNPISKRNTLMAYLGDEKAMQKAIDELDPRLKALADAMQKDREDHFAEYQKSYQDMGQRLGKIKGHYWPQMSAYRVAQGDRRPNSAEARDPNKQYPMALDGPDAFELYGQQVYRSAAAKSGFYSTIQRLLDLIDYRSESTTDDFNPENQAYAAKVYQKSREIRSLLIEQVGDPKIVDNFIDLLKDYVERMDSKEVDNSYVSILGRNAVTMLFAGNLRQSYKQFTQATGYYGLAENQSLYWANTAYAAAHYNEAKDEMTRRSSVMRDKFKGLNIDEQLSASAAQGGDSALMKWASNRSNLSPAARTFISTLQTWNKAALNAALKPMSWGAGAADVVGGYGLLKDFDARYPDDPARAVAEFEVAIQRHESNTNQAMRSLTQRKWNRDWRGQAITLMNDIMMKMSSMFRAGVGAYRGTMTAKAAAMEIMSTLTAIAVFSLVAAGVWNLFDDDDENDEAVYTALKSDFLSNLLGISPVANAFGTPLLKSWLMDYEYRFGTPLTKIMSELGDGDIATISTDAAALAGIFTPAAAALRTGKAAAYATSSDPKEQQVAADMALGASEKSAKRRAGIKKDVEKKDDED